jgi:hypothetical protein
MNPFILKVVVNLINYPFYSKFIAFQPLKWGRNTSKYSKIVHLTQSDSLSVPPCVKLTFCEHLEYISVTSVVHLQPSLFCHFSEFSASSAVNKNTLSIASKTYFYLGRNLPKNPFLVTFDPFLNFTCLGSVLDWDAPNA